MRMVDEVKNNIIGTLVNMNQYKSVLRSTPYRKVAGDMVLMYRVMKPEEDGSISTAIINDNLMEMIEIDSEEVLHEIALRNTPRLMGESVLSLGEGVTIITNRSRILGATSLLYTKRLHEIAELAESDLFIIPSSVHEIMVLPIYEARVDFLKATVREANGTLVTGREILSDEIYMYRRETGSIEVA